jgi:hypothetical protein
MGDFTIGCDPEMFLVEKKTGKLCSAIPYVVGEKHAPQPLPCGGNVQRDNVAIEFGTKPAETVQSFVEGIRSVLKNMKTIIPKELKMVPISSGNFDPRELEDPEARRFGCDPDFDAWEVSMNEAPSPADPTFRSCGGHIHVGVTEKYTFLLDLDGKIRTVRMMDAIHGIISTILDNSPESIKRRELYGKAGCHRPTDYGVEYRTLSNFWIKTPALVMLMYYLTQDVLEVIRLDRDGELINDIGEEEIRNVINNGQIEEARKILSKHITKHLSEDSKHYLQQCLVKIEENLELEMEWGI